MWVIRGGERDRLVDRFVDEGDIGIDLDEVPDAQILTRSEVRRYLDSDLSTAVLDTQADVVSAFVNEIQVGESILLIDSSRAEVVVGTVTDHYRFDAELPEGDARHRRTVDWLARHRIDELPAPLRSIAKQKPTLDQHRDAEWAGYLAQIRAEEIGRDPKDRPARPVRTAAPKRAAAASTRVTKPAIAQQTCSSCFIQTHPDRITDGVCLDCTG